MDPAVPVAAIVAEGDGGVIGIANHILHENVSAFTPTCYLQDLFVDPAARGAGAGRALVDWRVVRDEGPGLVEPVLEHGGDQPARPGAL